MSKKKKEKSTKETVRGLVIFFILVMTYAFYLEGFINFVQKDNFSIELDLLDNHQEDLFIFKTIKPINSYEDFYIFESVSNSNITCKIQLDSSFDTFTDVEMIYNKKYCMMKDYQNKQLQAYGYISK